MKPTACRSLAIASLASLLVAAAGARTRPRYGDMLRAETHAIVMSGDPSPEALTGLLFETLVTIDDKGQPQPALALGWSSTNNGAQWEFTLRPNVTFSDGTPLTAEAAARSLLQISDQSWQLRIAADRLIFDLTTPQPDLPALLSLPQFAISATGADGSIVGTGPFRLNKRSGDSLSLIANDSYWAGRPYVDALEFLVSRQPAEQMTDFSLDRADVAECPADQLRRAQQQRLRVDISRPTETLFLVFDSPKPELRDVRLRQAIALAIDRAAIRNVIFQHQGEIASGLLPDWLTGYEFLFDSAQDLSRARQLRNQLGTIPAMAIAYEPNDVGERLIAERIALNAHDIGLNMQAQPVTAGVSDLRVRRLSLASLDPVAALRDVTDRLNIPLTASAASACQSERAALESYKAIPLVHLPRITVLGSRVRNWSASPRGDWRLDEAWLAPRAARGEVMP